VDGPHRPRGEWADDAVVVLCALVVVATCAVVAARYYERRVARPVVERAEVPVPWCDGAGWVNTMAPARVGR